MGKVMLMKRRLVLMLALMVINGLALPLAARDTRADQPGIGDAAPLLARNGEQYGTITLLELVDPFDTIPPGYSRPDYDFRQALIRVRLTATNGPMPVYVSDFRVVDQNGYVSGVSKVTRDKDAIASDPNLPSSEIQTGESTEGIVLLDIRPESKVALIEYAPDDGQIVVVLDQREHQAEPGQAVAWIGLDGALIGEFTVTGIYDPILAYDPQSPPGRGNRFSGFVLAFTNLSNVPIGLSEHNFAIVDHIGLVTNDNGWRWIRDDDANAAAVPPLLSYEEIAPGDTMTVLVGDQLNSTASIKAILYTSVNHEMELRIAEFGGPLSLSALLLTPVPAPTLDLRCVEVMAWSREARAQLGLLEVPYDTLRRIPDNDGSVTPADVRAAATAIDAVADAMAALETPVIAQDASDVYVAYIRLIAEHALGFEEAIGARDGAAIDALVTEFENIDQELDFTPFEELGALCPAD
jgi:hypothetical protein